MGRGARRVLLVGVVLALTAAACGDDDGGATAVPTTGVETTTTAAWGEAVAPGAEAMLAGSRVLLREDFQDGDTAGWRVDVGWFVLENGERRMLGAGGEAWAWYQGGLDWSRYAARLAILVNEGSLGVSVAVSEEGRYLVHLSDAGVYLLKDAPYGQMSSLGSAQPISLGEPHVLAVGVDGGHLQVYADGVLLIDAIDPAPLAGGSIGLGAAAGSAVVVDNIVVASLGGPLPDIEVAAQPADQPLPDDLSDGAPDGGGSLEDGPEVDPGTPNLVISGVSYPMAIAYDEPFQVSLSATNTGETGAGAFTMAFTSHGDRCEASVDGLGAGERATVTCRFPGYAANGENPYEWTAAADAGGDVDEGGREDDNLAVGTIEVGATTSDQLPNLVIGWAERNPATPAPGEVVAVYAGVVQKNPAWGGRVPDLEFRVFYEDGTVACGATVASGEDSATCNLPPFEASGEYWLRLAIDEPGVLAESDESDNSLILPLQVSAISLVELPNLGFGGFEALVANPRAGQAFTVRMNVLCNCGEGFATAFTNRLIVDGVVACSKDWQAGYGFSPECDITLSAGIHQWAVEVDADDDVAESDEGDNGGWGQLTVNP